MKEGFEIAGFKPFGVRVSPVGRSFSVADLPVEKMRELVRQHHLLLLRGFETFERDLNGSEAFANYCASYGEISVWPFGRVLELVEQEKPQDHIFDNNYVPLHWDGMYRAQVPEFQVFHCVLAPLGGQGGRTTFSNTASVLEKATPQERELWGKVTGSYRRKMEYYDSHTVAPIIAKHPVKGFSVIRYNEPPRENDERFINHPALRFEGIEENRREVFHRSLQQALYSPENFYAHRWQTGDIVVTDNYTLLHGREAFISGAPRHLRRVHVLGEPPLNNPHLISHT